MKILKIEFQNINSLKGTHEIDFSKAPFTVSSLFAITGPTGSGKSTILDVISLALFNRIPRLPGNRTLSKGDIEKFGAVLTRNQKEAFAKITYQTNTGKFSSKWEISTARTGSLRNHGMEIADLGTGAIFDLKKSEVPAKNEELIGLSYEQFIKAVLLAQGEFAQLLKAEKKERGELLEKITGTGIYRQMGIKAFQKFKLVNAEIEDRQREIMLLEKGLLEEEVLEELNKQLLNKSAACEPLEKSVEQLDRQLQLKKNIKEQEQQVSLKEEQKQKAVANLQDFEASNLERLQKHEQVQVFADDLRKWQVLDKSCSEIKEELAAHARQEQENLVGINGCLEKIKTFLKTEPETGDIENSLREFSKKVRQLQQQRDEKLTTYKNLQERFHLELREVPFKLNGDLAAEETRLREMESSGKERLQELRTQLEDVDLENPEIEKGKLRKEIDLGRRAQQKMLNIQNLSEAIERAGAEEKSLHEEMNGLPQKIELLKEKSVAHRERLKNLNLQRENELLKASLEEHRHQLKDGQPCPLCGALEHPYAHELPPKQDELQQQVRAVQEALEEMEKQVITLSTNLAHHQKRLLQVQQELQEKEASLEVQKKDFQEQFSALPCPSGDWEDFCSGREKKLQLLDTFEQEKKKLSAILAGLPIISEIKQVLKQGKEIKAQLDTLYSGNDIDTDCLELQDTWTALKHQKSSLSRLFDDLNIKFRSKTSELESTEKMLQSKISEIDCQEIKEAIQRLLPEPDYLELRKKRESLTSQKREIEASLQTLKEQLEKLKSKDVEESAAVLMEKLSAAKKQLGEINEECEELRRKQRNHIEQKKKIEAIEAELAGAKKGIKRWELLNHLIGDATGKKFNDFAQDLSLSQLLKLANRRLIDLSDRYRIDKPLEDEDDSLIAIDDHMGGQRRSVKTLSGGETFLLSLSMALALSDLASKNVEINSLFIDEGFGTLDPETLDQTLDTLEKLQAESSKTIGVISHVDSLKERIATQIRLTRNGQGYSSLEIIG